MISSTFEGSTSYDAGGAIRVLMASTVLRGFSFEARNSTFSNNSVTTRAEPHRAILQPAGAGVLLSFAPDNAFLPLEDINILVDSCHFLSNRADNGGGAALAVTFLEATTVNVTVTLVDTEIRNNVAVGGGQVHLACCALSCGSYGGMYEQGAVYVLHTAGAQNVVHNVTNCIFESNTAVFPPLSVLPLLPLGTGGGGLLIMHQLSNEPSHSIQTFISHTSFLHNTITGQLCDRDTTTTQAANAGQFVCYLADFVVHSDFSGGGGFLIMTVSTVVKQVVSVRHVTAMGNRLPCGASGGGGSIWLVRCWTLCVCAHAEDAA